MGKFKYEPHYFETDIHAFKRYNELLKESRNWVNMGQYWLSNQCDILADMLLKGDTSKIDIIVKSEDHYFKTKKCGF